MYLAVILGLCALTNSAVATAAPSGVLVAVAQENPPSDANPAAAPHEPAQNSQGAAQEPSKPPAAETPGTTSPSQQAEPESPATAKPAAPKAAVKRRHRKPTATAANAPAEKKVVRNGGTADPVVQLSPGVSDEQASRQRQSTAQLLSSTDTNLKQLSARQLSDTQQASISQIRKYMEQAKAAEESGDVQRAQNLASKALMLSDDLVKH